jgi:hypothetical protein
MLRAGLSIRNTTNHFSTTVRLNQRFLATNSVSDKQKPGAPRVTTLPQDRFIRLTHLGNRFLAPSQTANVTPGCNRQRISSQTVRRMLRENDLIARCPYKGSVLTQRHKRQRFECVLRHLHWTRQLWDKDLFSDESHFHPSRVDGHTRALRVNKHSESIANNTNSSTGGNQNSSNITKLNFDL